MKKKTAGAALQGSYRNPQSRAYGGGGAVGIQGGQPSTNMAAYLQKKAKSKKKHKVLTSKERKDMPKGEFAVPSKRRGGKGGYPIPDKAHARNALARVSQFGTAAEKAEVRAKVHAKFPDIGKKKKKAIWDEEAYKRIRRKVFSLLK